MILITVKISAILGSVLFVINSPMSCAGVESQWRYWSLKFTFYYIYTYRKRGNFRGKKISWFTKNFIIQKKSKVKNFVDKFFIYHAWSRQNPVPYVIVPSVRETNNIDSIHLQSQ